MPRKKKDSVEHIELTQEELNNIVKPKKNKNHYIDNKLFFQEMIDWKKKVNEAHDQGDPTPPVSDYIGLCFYEIAQNLAKKPNFVNYPFKEDMIGDGIENCLMYCSNFDPSKSSNPFSYFTQIIYYAFLRKIAKEKKQNYIKYKYLKSLDTKGEFSEILKAMGFSEDDTEHLEEMDKKLAPKKRKTTKRKKKNLEDLMDE
jgi:hypothetical protein